MPKQLLLPNKGCRGISPAYPAVPAAPAALPSHVPLLLPFSCLSSSSQPVLWPISSSFFLVALSSIGSVAYQLGTVGHAHFWSMSSGSHLV